ncbi:MAG: hypothetical protein HY072_07495 [Deltaproteobacteria bacterium]|nr:hypothetical protein [Deltaproteobacteria bacterium]
MKDPIEQAVKLKILSNQVLSLYQTNPVYALIIDVLKTLEINEKELSELKERYKQFISPSNELSVTSKLLTQGEPKKAFGLVKLVFNRFSEFSPGANKWYEDQNANLAHQIVLMNRILRIIEPEIYHVGN